MNLHSLVCVWCVYMHSKYLSMCWCIDHTPVSSWCLRRPSFAHILWLSLVGTSRPPQASPVGISGKEWSCDQHSLSTQWSCDQHSLSTQWSCDQHSLSTQWSCDQHSLSTQWYVINTPSPPSGHVINTPSHTMVM